MCSLSCSAIRLCLSQDACEPGRRSVPFSSQRRGRTAGGDPGLLGSRPPSTRVHLHHPNIGDPPFPTVFQKKTPTAKQREVDSNSFPDAFRLWPHNGGRQPAVALIMTSISAARACCLCLLFPYILQKCCIHSTPRS